jgi:signal transduction histidine kinase
LAIAKSIVELHGGSIQVKSVPGEGSQFLIEIPTF